MSDPEEIQIPEEVADFGDLLRQLRQYHGFTISQLSKRLGLPAADISAIEVSNKDLPTENILISWLSILGCSKIQTKKMILASRTFRIKHWIMLHRKEPCNPDIVRILDAYRNQKLTPYDKVLLRVIAR